MSEMVDLSPMHMIVIEREVKPTKLDAFARIANDLVASADELLQNMMDKPAESLSSELYEMIMGLPKMDRTKLLHIVKDYIEVCDLKDE